jgi:hypothetical protein
VPLDERLQEMVERLAARLESVVKIRAAVKTRWLERVRARADELGPSGDGTEPTSEQVDGMLVELLRAEADVQRATEPAEATAVAPIAVRIAEAAARGPDDDGDATLQREGRRTLLPVASPGRLPRGHAPASDAPRQQTERRPPMMTRNFDGLFLVALGPRPPSDGEWAAYLDAVRRVGTAKTRHIMHTEGGWPTEPQRRELLALLEGHAIPVVIVSRSPLMLSAASGLAGFNTGIKVFHLSSLLRAIGSLGVPTKRVGYIMRETIALAADAAAPPRTGGTS